ncbi:MAG: hypothetical protein QM535_19230 [Limnohabitans sp.]|nr:hypothetical protein [Limnohabitans sp.]
MSYQSLLEFWNKISEDKISKHKTIYQSFEDYMINAHVYYNSEEYHEKIIEFAKKNGYVFNILESQSFSTALGHLSRDYKPEYSEVLYSLLNEVLYSLLNSKYNQLYQRYEDARSSQQKITHSHSSCINENTKLKEHITTLTQENQRLSSDKSKLNGNYNNLLGNYNSLIKTHDTLWNQHIALKKKEYNIRLGLYFTVMIILVIIFTVCV